MGACHHEDWIVGIAVDECIPPSSIEINALRSYAQSNTFLNYKNTWDD
jgi:hypothetical protein